MTVVFVMSTDRDIINTGVHANWNPISARYNWAQVSQGGLNVPAHETVIVIAHGNNTEIGNAQSGHVDINPATFIQLIQRNVIGGAPASIYISTCGLGLAQFAAGVRIAAEQQNIWQNTHLYGHHDPAGGQVPPSTVLAWTQIF